jgi:hypothetical protein
MTREVEVEPRTLESPPLPRAKVRKRDHKGAPGSKQPSRGGKIVQRLDDVLERMVEDDGVKVGPDTCAVEERPFDGGYSTGARMRTGLRGRVEAADVPAVISQRNAEITPTTADIQQSSRRPRAKNRERTVA